MKNKAMVRSILITDKFNRENISASQDIIGNDIFAEVYSVGTPLARFSDDIIDYYCEEWKDRSGLPFAYYFKNNTIRVIPDPDQDYIIDFFRIE